MNFESPFAIIECHHLDRRRRIMKNASRTQGAQPRARWVRDWSGVFLSRTEFSKRAGFLGRVGVRCRSWVVIS